MQQSVAINLIKKGVDKTTSVVWADFGAGSGVFTNALATLLGKGSTIYAIDQNKKALGQIEVNVGQATIVKLEKNFLKDELHLPGLAGILMANSLHYVQDKELFVEKLRKMLMPQGRLLIIEYDTLASNQWVPYPVDFTSLSNLMTAAGFTSISKLGEQPSQFRQSNIYSALVR